jgi:hypothetical protein
MLISLFVRSREAIKYIMLIQELGGPVETREVEVL